MMIEPGENGFAVPEPALMYLCLEMRPLMPAIMDLLSRGTELRFDGARILGPCRWRRRMA